MSNNNPVLSGSIFGTFFYYVLPSIIGLVAITSANLVDGFFVGNAIGSQALAAITLMIPYFTLLIAVALMLAIGGSVSAGKAIGENNSQKASDIFSQALIAAAVINSLFAFTSFFFEQELFTLLNIPIEIIPLAAEYFAVIRWVFILQLTTMVLYYFVRADGHPHLATAALVCGAFLNIIFDAWFILILDMGLAGAAYATAIAQIVQLLVLSYYFISKHKTLTFNWFQKNWSLFRTLTYNGISEFINEISVGVIFFILNTLMLNRLGVDGVAAFTLVNYFIFLSIMLSYGFADALHLVVSQNYGACQFVRVKHFLRVAVLSTVTLGAVIVCLLSAWPETVLGWFVNDSEINIYQVSNQLLPLLIPLFFINGTNIVLTCYLTAIHQPRPSAIIAFTRSLLLPATLLLIFYYFLPTKANSFSFLIALPIAEWAAFCLATWFCYQYRPSRLPTNRR